jgi:hypothetical protein
MKMFIESKLTFVYDFGNDVVLIPGVNNLEVGSLTEKITKSENFKNRVKIGQFKVLNEAEAAKAHAAILAEIKRRDEEEKAKG